MRVESVKNSLDVWETPVKCKNENPKAIIANSENKQRI
jgi:hypothetical protein